MARILVVEDDPDVLTLVIHKLRRAGHEVTSAVDGVAGLAAVRAEHPDLMILDWMMPRMTGLELCHTVREDTAVSRTRILMLTAKAQETDVERAFASGADEYILKPFNSKELLARIDALLARE